jgi:hypothetical protein
MNKHAKLFILELRSRLQVGGGRRIGLGLQQGEKAQWRHKGGNKQSDHIFKFYRDNAIVNFASGNM